MTKITNIKSREILDSRGNPTVECEVYTKKLMARASSPSGASTGTHEAKELRDNDERFLGKGVQKALKNIEKKIKPILLGRDCKEQKLIDYLMINKDNTIDKSNLGANSLLAVSLACAKAGAKSSKQELYKYLNRLLDKKRKVALPKLFFNVINGGKHADNKLSFQEFMIVPNLSNLKKNIQAASEIYHILKQDLHKKYGRGSTNVGDEGGFAPDQLHFASDALDILVKAINDAGYKNKVDIAIDVAASEFYKEGKYDVDGKKLTKKEMLNYYLKLIKKYSIISIEDPFEQEDFISFALLKKKSKIQIVGDDLTVTNINRINQAIDNKSCNCLLLKVNQIGTLTEAIDAVDLAYKNGWKVMVSHRSGETEDTFIADLAVGIGCSQLKAGAPCRGERLAKYNQLLRISELVK